MDNRVPGTFMGVPLQSQHVPQLAQFFPAQQHAQREPNAPGFDEYGHGNPHQPGTYVSLPPRPLNSTHAAAPAPAATVSAPPDESASAPVQHQTRDRKPEAWYEAVRRAMTAAPGTAGDGDVPLFQTPSTETLVSINTQYGAGKVTLEMAKLYVKERKKSLARSLARQKAAKAFHDGDASRQQYHQQQQQQQQQAVMGGQLMQGSNAATVGNAMMSALNALLSPPTLPTPLPPPLALPPVAQQPAKPERRRGPRPELMQWYACMRDILRSGRAVGDEELMQLIAKHVPAGTQYTLAQARAYMTSRVYTTTKRKRQAVDDAGDGAGEGGWEGSSGEEDEEDEGAGRHTAGDAEKPVIIAKSRAAPVQQKQQTDGDAAGGQPPLPVAGFPGVYMYAKVPGAYYHLVPVGGDAVYMGCHATPAGAQRAYQAALARKAVEVLRV